MILRMSIFEIGMLICFGLAWPLSIIKSYRSKSTKGKSLFFMIIILMGYISAILHKIFYSYDYVLVLYVLNFLMVFTDIILYFRNKKTEKSMGLRDMGASV